MSSSQRFLCISDFSSPWGLKWGWIDSVWWAMWLSWGVICTGKSVKHQHSYLLENVDMWLLRISISRLFISFQCSQAPCSDPLARWVPWAQFWPVPFSQCPALSLLIPPHQGYGTFLMCLQNDCQLFPKYSHHPVLAFLLFKNGNYNTVPIKKQSKANKQNPPKTCSSHKPGVAPQPLKVTSSITTPTAPHFDPDCLSSLIAGHSPSSLLPWSQKACVFSVSPFAWNIQIRIY